MTGRRVEPGSISSDGTPDESVFVIAGLLNADGAAYRGVRSPKMRPMRIRAAAGGDQSQRRKDEVGREEKRRRDKITTRRGGTSRFNEL